MVAPVTNGRLVGYARVSTDDQDLSLQIDSLIGLGIPRDDIFTEKISGAKTDRPELNACLAKLQQGDTLVVWRLDRLGRSMHRHNEPISELILLSIDDICMTLNISKSTYYRYVQLKK